MSSDLIKTLRDKLGLSQEQLSEVLGLAGKNVVSRWELGERAPGEPVRRLCKYLIELPKDEAKSVLARFRKYGAEAIPAGGTKRTK